ncbi:hypothetical protein CspeluHIS016_0505010 [Cutaneotrichosporon spelunceum]|uniref:BTB domain-containing protein n=1 Tax=Cutaneotrichosporon spelunceum TaxID=1672016 RepID=A0AAD3TX73_9TREE|nr:hypothetical protein CspeluHIS016_0505010 [Cutaneotrichosporon spelunceum]
MLSTPLSLADSDGSMTPMTPLPPPVIDMQDDAEWTAGDFEVITSDCHRFRVPSYHLMSSSTLFYKHARHSLSITFTAPTETAAIFRLALHLLTKGRLGSGEAWHIQNLQSLAAFLGRWEMEAALSNFVTHFQARVHIRDPSVLGLPGFLVGAYADSIEVCVATLRIPSVEWGRDPGASGSGSSGQGVASGLGVGVGVGASLNEGHEWAGHNTDRDPWSKARTRSTALPTPAPESLVAGARGRPTFDPASWPLATFTAGHPPAYLFALARAWGSAGRADARLPAEFVAFLRAAKAAGA